MNTYTEYKPVGLPWLSEMPSHWRVLRNKNVMWERKEVVGENSSNFVLLSLTLNGVIPRDMVNAKGKFPKDFDTYKVVSENDMVFCLFDIDETPRTVGLAKHNGMITGAYDIFGISGIDSRYLYYYYLAIDSVKAMKPYYTGLRKVIGVPKFLGLNLPVPPLDEQEKIVRFLDWKVSRINKLTNALKKQIALLAEQKQAIINKAVTKGLDPNTPMKNSGVAWLGDVPEHWKICKLKHLATYKSGDNLTSLQITDIGEFPVYGGNGFRGFYSTRNYSGDYLLVGRQGALCGNVHRVNGDFWATDHAVTVKSVAGVDIEWLYYLLLTMNLNQYSRAAAQPGLAVEYVINVQTVFPELSEQILISKRIKEQEKPIDSIIEKINRQISLLSEYRTRLISDVVTGKLDVRGVVVPEYDVADAVVDEELPEDEEIGEEDGENGEE